ncbi:MAG: phosphoenolpyruvate carboxykinase (ATP) [Thermotoga sp.]|nr:MAG: phosphoenolpyruvate carboxykinase (ATP) [Thermotoga sp.]
MQKDYNLKDFGITNVKNVYHNLTRTELAEKSAKNKEGFFTNSGAFNVLTGENTGRSPKDRFIVDQASIHDKVDWNDINMPTSKEVFNRIYIRATSYLYGKDVFIFDGFAGHDLRYALSLRVITDLASTALLSENVFVSGRGRDPSIWDNPDLTIIAVPSCKAVPEIDGVHSNVAIIFNLEKKIAIVMGSRYGGEVKKVVFSVMNFLLPEKNVFPMHCSANTGKDNKTALFFGLSGTGKTTLSTDPERILIGDDEHGWSDHGIFNIEGGCYAKVIGITPDNAPEIYNAIKFGVIMENVDVNENREPDFSSKKYTENTRAAIPLAYIPNAKLDAVGSPPSTIFFLSADAFGVLPPISRLTKEQAMYYFISGYTAKVAGTETGVVEPIPTFSACFGAPFMMRHPVEYAKMLGEKIEKYNTDVYLINTGWSGGPFGIGSRIKLRYTRQMIRAALNGRLKNVHFIKEPYLNLSIPEGIPGSDVPKDILFPDKVWNGKSTYEEVAKKLSKELGKNFEKFADRVPEEIYNVGPK